jgi:hypothetical protein
MTPAPLDEDRLANASKEEIMSALFADMATQLANTALIFLGQIPHPETRETVVDLESAKMFIDQLEMLEFKTRGNLDPEESRLLQQGISTAKSAFVEALNAQVDEEPTEKRPSSKLGEPPSVSGTNTDG